jgi:hypothetical protein
MDKEKEIAEEELQKIREELLASRVVAYSDDVE